MIDPKKIEQIARQVHESMPKGLRDLGEDVEKKIRQALQSQLTVWIWLAAKSLTCRLRCCCGPGKNWRCWSSA